MHFVVGLAHGAAHGALGIIPAPLDIAFIVGVVFVAPLMAVPVLRRAQTWAGGGLALAMIAALVYGVANHFLLPGADHVNLDGSDPWTGVFAASAMLLAALELAIALLATASFLRVIRTPSAAAGRGSSRD